MKKFFLILLSFVLFMTSNLAASKIALFITIDAIEYIKYSGNGRDFICIFYVEKKEYDSYYAGENFRAYLTQSEHEENFKYLEQEYKKQQEESNEQEKKK